MSTGGDELQGAPSRRPIFRKTVVLSLSSIPLWVLRFAVASRPTLAAGVVIVLLDACLFALHLYANRQSDVAYRDWFGMYRSWTRLFYTPELLAAYFVVFDGWNLWQALRSR